MSENAVAEQLEMPKHGEFCWNELSGNNLEECKKFYSVRDSAECGKSPKNANGTNRARK
jgi:hypothetical protein